eukprot:2655415-Alexandrium_andersonii.AAC.1
MNGGGDSGPRLNCRSPATGATCNADKLKWRPTARLCISSAWHQPVAKRASCNQVLRCSRSPSRLRSRR